MRYKVARRLSLQGFDPRPLRIPLSILGVVFIIASYVVTHGWDLHSYTDVDLADPYAGIDTLNEFAVFRYAPPVALIAPFERNE